MRGNFVTPENPDDDDTDHAPPKQDTTLDALRAFGVQPEQPLAAREDDGVFYLWPEHMQALLLWRGVQTQWRVGWNGRTGLDYAGVHFWMGFAGIAEELRAARFAELQTMERAALLEWAAMREEKRQ